jgi:CRP/FNR family transcriptional regulator, cyclic AMP receptor protein
MEWRLLKDVPPDQVRELLKIARRRTFVRNEVVFHRDDPGDSLHLVSKGRFAIRVMTPLGDTATIAIRGPGESFGEMALVGGMRRSATVAAVEDAETFSIYEREFAQLRREHPAVNDLLVRFLVSQVRMLNDRLLEALYLPVERRVVRRLVELADLYGSGEGVPEIALTQETIADLAGAKRPTVNQVLRKEADRGVIEVMRGRIRILDLDGLRTRGGS